MKSTIKRSLAVTAGILALAIVTEAGANGRQVNGRQLGLGNELIDVTAFQKAAAAAILQRKERRITESQFIAMAAEEGTIILDTRSKGKFALLHVKGARHLNFSDITTESLAKVIPTKDTRILIYCNNNFDKAPKAFPSKTPSTALNIPTYITLFAYGYKNVYELGPLLDVKKTKIQLEGMRLAALGR